MHALKIIFLIIGAVFLFAHNSPYSLKIFQPVLDASKLQAPLSKFDPLYSRHYGDFKYYQNRYFYLQDDKYMVFEMCGNHHRSELRLKHDWKVSTSSPETMEAEVKLFPLNEKREFTFLQIHADSTLTDEPVINKPLLRIVWYKELHNKYSHLWAVIRESSDVFVSKYKKIDLGVMPEGFFNVKITVQKNILKVFLNNRLKVDENVSYWDRYSNYFKAGVYLQDEGCSRVLFKKLVIEGEKE